ncbi:hypothetical protein [Neobacillus cucumis]|uniref:hypothetical protein n=1 Tax=Neobacillus cucumis TaxID=1740721 RepID=UPI002E1BB080|nr:hypothetical protein [Neobacillus cucumis]
MAAQDSKQQNRNTLNSAQGSGSEYHREHAGNVPDYGGNSMEQIAKDQLNNQTDRTNK